MVNGQELLIELGLSTSNRPKISGQVLLRELGLNIGSPQEAVKPSLPQPQSVVEPEEPQFTQEEVDRGEELDRIQQLSASPESLNITPPVNDLQEFGFVGERPPLQTAGSGEAGSSLTAPALPATPSLREQLEKEGVDDIFNPGAKLVGAGETAVSMGTGFAAALPAVAVGIKEVIEKGDINAFADAFNFTQDLFTFDPRTEKGKEFTAGLQKLFEKLDTDVIEPFLVEPNIRQGNPEVALAGSIGAQALALLLPALKVGKIRPKSTEAIKNEPGQLLDVDINPQKPRQLSPDKILEELPETELAQVVESVKKIESEKPLITESDALIIDKVEKALAEKKTVSQQDLGEFLLASARKFEKEAKAEAIQKVETEGTGIKLNTGIPVEEIAEGFNKATQSLKDGLGIAEEGVEIIKPEIAKQPGLLNPFKSMRKVVEKFPKLKPLKEAADKAQVTQDRLRDIFGRRLRHVDKRLGKDISRIRDLGKSFRANKDLMSEFLFEADLLGRDFTDVELRAKGANEQVIRGYKSLRSTYDKALSLINKTRELRGKTPVNKRGGYVPHFFHNYFVIGGDGKIMTSAKTLRQATAIANEAIRGGESTIKIVPKQFRFPGEENLAITIGDQAFFKVRKNIEDTFSLSVEEANDLLANFAKRKGRSRFVGNFLQRKGVEGFEKDLNFINNHYFNMVSRFVALDEFKSKSISNFERNFGSFDKEHTGLAKFAKNYINDINGVPSSVETLLNSTLANIPGFSKFLGKFLGDRPALQIASMTTNAVAIAKLGLFNVSSAAVNASQLMMANALIGPKFMAIGIKDSVKAVAALSEKKITGTAVGSRELGLLNKFGIGIQQGLESGAGYSKFGPGQLFRKSTAIFQAVEFQLRAATSLGAYRKAIAEGKTREQAIEFAKEINIRANFNYGIADTPSFIRQSGPIGQVLFQFKKFPIKALEFMTELKGAENPRFWIPFVLVSGYYGFPGVEGVKNMVKRLFDVDIELESKDFLIQWAGNDKEKKAIAKTIMFGAFSNKQLGGVDLSRRIGAGDFIPSQSRDLLGPAFSSVIRATQLAAQGNYVEALRAVATAPGNLALALRNDGELTSPYDRDRLTTKLDKGQRVLKALGFSTTQESVERDVSRIIKHRERKIRDEKKRAIDGYIRVMDSNDNEKIDTALGKLGELGITSKQIMTEIIKKDMTRSERAFFDLSKAGKIRNFELLDFNEPQEELAR